MRKVQGFVHYSPIVQNCSVMFTLEPDIKTFFPNLSPVTPIVQKLAPNPFCETDAQSHAEKLRHFEKVGLSMSQNVSKRRKPSLQCYRNGDGFWPVCFPTCD